MNNISVVIPIYNEELNIEKLFNEIIEFKIYMFVFVQVDEVKHI